jgi:chromosome segregation ATPase
MESVTEALERIKKVLDSLEILIRELKDKERLVSKLQSKIITLEKRRGDLETSLIKGEEEFLAMQKRKGEDIIVEAERKGRAKADQILADARRQNSDLLARIETYKKQIQNFEQTYHSKSAEVAVSIREFEEKKDSLMKEIVSLTHNRDELQRQISSIRERVSAILK